MSSGYLKLWRTLPDSPVWSLTTAQRIVFVTILLEANWKPGIFRADGKTTRVRRGEFITSLNRLAGKAGVSKSCVVRALKSLSDLGTIETTPARKWTAICVVNYERYQRNEQEGDTNSIPTAIPVATPLPSTYEGTSSSPNRRRKKKEGTTKGRSLEPPPEAIELATSLFESIRARQPDNKSVQSCNRDKTIALWANAFRLAHNQDGRSWEDLKEVLAWSQRDPFWQANILSAAKLREKFDQLKARMPKAVRARGFELGDIGGLHECG